MPTRNDFIPFKGHPPTSAEINALPEHIRFFIMDLEARMDPAGDVRARLEAEDTVNALVATIEDRGEIPRLLLMRSLIRVIGERNRAESLIGAIERTLMVPAAEYVPAIPDVFKLCATSMEHRLREHFTYKTARVFGPHFDIEDLVKLCLVRETAGSRPANAADTVHEFWADNTQELGTPISGYVCRICFRVKSDPIHAKVER